VGASRLLWKRFGEKVIFEPGMKYCVRGPKTESRWSPAHLRWGRGWPLETYFSPTCLTVPISVILGQTEIRQNIWPLTSRISGSLKVIETLHGSIGCLWLPILLIHSNLYSYRFRQKRRFLSKIVNFSHSVYLRWGSSSWNFVTRLFMFFIVFFVM